MPAPIIDPMPITTASDTPIRRCSSSGGPAAVGGLLMPGSLSHPRSYVVAVPLRGGRRRRPRSTGTAFSLSGR
ncbi:hypothetical protein GCM10010507_00430 [Streptomyces cinnamoneus]|uniref:Uncharacterized protein n=1 Tax=Streptomyces cinnamoneus TaxID=53446 RepID=A0A918WE42_STRCJ|nr:hypothetical protein GCM10010507_00430 [Streptomyces cinnamoneus]